MRFPTAYALLVVGPLAFYAPGCASTHLAGPDGEAGLTVPGSGSQIAQVDVSTQHLMELGKEYEQVGRIRDAQQVYDLVLDSDSQHAEARLRRDMLETRAQLNRELSASQLPDRSAGQTDEPPVLSATMAPKLLSPETSDFVLMQASFETADEADSSEVSQVDHVVAAPVHGPGTFQVANDIDPEADGVKQVSWWNKLNPFAKKDPPPKRPAPTPRSASGEIAAHEASMARQADEEREKIRRREILAAVGDPRVTERASRIAARKGIPLPPDTQQRLQQQVLSNRLGTTQQPTPQYQQPTTQSRTQTASPTSPGNQHLQPLGNGLSETDTMFPTFDNIAPEPRSSNGFEILPLEQPKPEQSPLAINDDPLAEWNLFDDVPAPRSQQTPTVPVVQPKASDDFWELEPHKPAAVVEPTISLDAVAPVEQEPIWNLSGNEKPQPVEPPSVRHPLVQPKPTLDLLPPRETPIAGDVIAPQTASSTKTFRSGLFDEEVTGPLSTSPIRPETDETRRTPNIAIEPIAPEVTPSRSPRLPARPDVQDSRIKPLPPRSAVVDQETVPLPELDPLLDISLSDSQTSTAPITPIDDVERRSPDYQSIPTETPAVVDTVADVPQLWSGPTLTSYCRNLAPKLRPIIERLDYPSIEVRKQGLADLAILGPDAMSAIPAVEVLIDDVPIVAAHAAWTLLQIDGDQQTTAHVMQQLVQEPDEEVVQFAAYALGSIGPHARSATPQLRIARERYSGITRLHIAEALTRIDAFDEGSVDILIDSLHDRERQHRWLAAIALGQVSTRHATRVVPALTSALRDTDAQVRSAAALSVGRFGPAARSAVNELQSRAALDAPEVREAARTSLACIPH
ncbi:MAG: HEAT repeat domain-containing protein [Planctomycetaceae bacterium]